MSNESHCAVCGALIVGGECVLCNPKTPDELQAAVDRINHKGLRDTLNKAGREFGILPMGEVYPGYSSYVTQLDAQDKRGPKGHWAWGRWTGRHFVHGVEATRGEAEHATLAEHSPTEEPMP